MWEFTNDRPIYLQIIEQMTLMVANGTYKPGDKVPSVREMATLAGVNPNTVQRAYAELERNEIVSTMRTTGRYITEDTARITSVKESLAKEKIDSFLKNMNELGISPEEVIRIISERI